MSNIINPDDYIFCAQHILFYDDVEKIIDAITSCNFSSIKIIDYTARYDNNDVIERYNKKNIFLMRSYETQYNRITYKYSSSFVYWFNNLKPREMKKLIEYDFQFLLLKKNLNEKNIKSAINNFFNSHQYTNLMDIVLFLEMLPEHLFKTDTIIKLITKKPWIIRHLKNRHSLLKIYSDLYQNVGYEDSLNSFFPSENSKFVPMNEKMRILEKHGFEQFSLWFDVRGLEDELRDYVLLKYR